MSPKKRKSNPRPRPSVGIDLQAAAANKGFDEDSLRMTAADAIMGNSPDMGTIRTPGLYLDPMLDPVLTLFPQDNKREENRRYRHYYKVSPYIRSIIDFHVETPISDFDMRAEESEEIQEYYQDYKDRVNLLEVCTNALRDYWLLGECEPAGTKILMANGTEQDIESIRRGDEVITHTGHVRRVIAPTIRTAHEPLYGVTVRGNGKVPHWMTGNHPVLVAKEGKHPCKQGFWNDACLKPQPCKITAHGRNRLDGTHKIWRYPCKQYIDDIALEFMPVNQLREGDYVVTPQYQEQGTSPTIEMARFLGYYASEGCMIKNDKYTIGYSGVIVANTNDKIAQDMIALGQVLIGRKPSIRLVNNCKVIVFYSVQLAQQIVDLCQGLAPSKVLSDTVMKWPVTHQKEFLKAFVLGDGCVSNGQAILYTSSSKMASQLRTMCVRVGMHPSHCVTNKIGRPPFLKQIKECTIYQIKLSREDSLKIFEDFEKLGQIRSSKNIHFSFIKSGYQFKKISGVKHKEHNGLVYSMEVERDHSYVAEGIAVHNSFTYGNWDVNENEFSDFMQYPPEELEIVSTYVSPKKVFALRPNKEVSKILRGMNPSDSTIAEYIRTMMPEQASAIENNQPYPLKEDQLIIMQRTMAQYINRGVSPLLAVVKDLLYEDWLNLYRTSFLQRHSYPLKLFKLGSESKGFIPNRKMFAEFRSQLVQASQDPDYNLVTHPFINVEYVTGQDKILQLIPYYELVKARIFAGLFVSDAIISGEKTPYAAGITFMKGLMNRYLTVRNQLELEVKRKVFYHLARMQKFYMPTKAEIDHKVRTRKDDERLIIPEFFWKKANLISNQAVMQMAMSLRDKKEIPMRFIAELMGWDMDDIIYELKREEGTRADPKYRKAVEDAIAKSPDLARKVILGDDVDEALKAMFKEQKEQTPEAPPKTSTPSKGRGKSEEFKLPETAGPSTVVRPEPPEGGERPPEASEGKGPAAPPEGGLAERKPRPGEKEGTPGGAAGA